MLHTRNALAVLGLAIGATTLTWMAYQLGSQDRAGTSARPGGTVQGAAPFGVVAAAEGGGDTGNRVSGPGSLRTLRVTVQARPGEAHRPLASGTARIAGAGPNSALPIEGGRISVLEGPWSEAEFRVLSVQDDSGKSLFVSLDADSSKLRCYGYPGIFVQGVGAGPGPSTSKLEAMEFSGDPNLGSEFDVPPSWNHVTELSTDGEGPTFVEALSPGNSSYWLRFVGQAWQRVEANDCPLGGTVTLESKPSGSVVFSTTISGLHRTPKLVVRGLDGEAIMRPRLSDAVQYGVGGWPAGTYEAFLTVASTDSPVFAVSGRETFEVFPGQSTQVILAAPEEGESNELGHLSGILSFESWELVEPWFLEYGLRLTIEPLEGVDNAAFNSIRRRDRILPVSSMADLQSMPNGSPAWGWDAGQYPAGRYRLQIEPIRSWIEFSVEAEQETVLDRPVPVMAVAVIEGGVASLDASAFAPLLSYPLGWSSYPESNDSPKLLTTADGAMMMITEPGEYSLNFLWGTRFVQEPLELLPGWNTVFLNLGEVATSILAIQGEDGEPLDLDRSDWDSITAQAQDGGHGLELIPMHVRSQGASSWSQAIIDVSGGPGVVIGGLRGLGFEEDSMGLEMPTGGVRVLGLN